MAQAEVTYSISVDGVEMYGFAGSWTNPLDPSFGGCQIVLHNEADGTNHANDVIVASVPYPGNTFTTPMWPIDGPEPTWDAYFVSFDVNHNCNSLVPGTTPRVTGLNPVLQTTGSLMANRLAAGTYDSTIHVSAGKLGVNQISVANFASGIAPVLLNASDPALPNALYPAGTIEYNTTSHTLKKVNSAGTAWELMVNGGTDIQAGTVAAVSMVANTITAGQMAAGAIGTAQLFAGQIKVGGGAGMPSQFEVVDGSGSPIGWIGTDSGNVGAWFKTCRVGGTGYSSAPFQADSSGNVTITGAGTNVAIAVQSVYLGVTTTISLGGAVNGLTAQQVISGVTYDSYVNGSEILITNNSNNAQAAFLFDSSNRPYCEIIASGSSFTNVPYAYHCADSSHYSALGPASLTMTGLPSASPGAGTKQFWYDPATGLVHFAA